MKYTKIEVVENKLDNDNDQITEQCTCNEYHDEHTCPYQEEINNDYETLCSCCLYCEMQCGYEI